MDGQAWTTGAGAPTDAPAGAPPAPDPARVRAVLAGCGVLPGGTDALGDGDDLYAAGLTSHGSVTLMLALEETFGIEFPDALLRRRTFESIAAIRAAVDSLLDGAGLPDGTARA